MICLGMHNPYQFHNRQQLKMQIIALNIQNSLPLRINIMKFN